MNITCPECQFSKEVAEEDLPKRTVIANCPKCGCRFRLAPGKGVVGVIEPEQDPDDPLPEGAIVVAREKDQEKVTEGQESRDDTVKSPLSPEKPVRPAPLRSLSFGQGNANPWDKAPGRIGWFASFSQTCMRVMFAAPRFFASLAPECRLFPPLTFYVFLSLFEYAVNTGWVQIFRTIIADTEDPQLAALLSLLAPQGNLILMLLLQAALATLKLYLISGLFYLAFRFIANGRATYSLIFQVVAYSIAPAVLAIVPIAGSLCGALWSLACLAVGLRQTLSLSWLQTVCGFLPVILLFAASMRFLAAV